LTKVVKLIDWREIEKYTVESWKCRTCSSVFFYGCGDLFYWLQWNWEMVCCNTALYLRCQIDLVDWFGGFCFSKKKTGPRRALDWLLLWWSSKLSQDYDGVHFCCVHALAPIPEDQGTLGPNGSLAASGLGGGGGVELSLLAHHFWFSLVFDLFVVC